MGNGQQGQPEIVNMGGIEVCSECGTPVGPPHEVRLPNGVVGKKRMCPGCGVTFALQGGQANRWTPTAG